MADDSNRRGCPGRPLCTDRVCADFSICAHPNRRGGLASSRLCLGGSQYRPQGRRHLVLVCLFLGGWSERRNRRPTTMLVFLESILHEHDQRSGRKGDLLQSLSGRTATEWALFQLRPMPSVCCLPKAGDRRHFSRQWFESLSGSSGTGSPVYAGRNFDGLTLEP